MNKEKVTETEIFYAANLKQRLDNSFSEAIMGWILVLAFTVFLWLELVYVPLIVVTLIAMFATYDYYREKSNYQKAKKTLVDKAKKTLDKSTEM